jgi:phosphatidylserine/phosphatidylglycerophosphate/cardiolipin synthase-like enzyme
MRKEKEKAFAELLAFIGKESISTKSEFHGRAIIVDNKAIIGSMDIDSYSLTGARIEFAVYTEDPEVVRKLRNYFNQTFSPLKNSYEPNINDQND